LRAGRPSFVLSATSRACEALLDGRGGAVRRAVVDHQQLHGQLAYVAFDALEAGQNLLADVVGDDDHGDVRMLGHRRIVSAGAERQHPAIVAQDGVVRSYEHYEEDNP